MATTSKARAPSTSTVTKQLNRAWQLVATGDREGARTIADELGATCDPSKQRVELGMAQALSAWLAGATAKTAPASLQAMGPADADQLRHAVEHELREARSERKADRAYTLARYALETLTRNHVLGSFGPYDKPELAEHIAVGVAIFGPREAVQSPVTSTAPPGADLFADQARDPKQVAAFKKTLRGKRATAFDDAKLADVQVQLGWLLVALGRTAEARALFEQATARLAPHLGARRQAATAAAWLGADVDACVRERAVNPDCLKTWTEIIVAEAARQKPKAALPALANTLDGIALGLVLGEHAGVPKARLAANMQTLLASCATQAGG